MRSPGEMVSAVPYLLGFVPTDSLVIVVLDDKRIALTARVDLADLHDADCIEQIVEAAGHANGTGAFLIAYGESRFDTAPALARVEQPLTDAGLEVRNLVSVVDGRWFHERCTDERCCSPGGMAVADHDIAPTTMALSTHTGGYRADRDAVVAECRPDRPLLLAAIRSELEMPVQGEDFTSETIAADLCAVLGWGSDPAPTAVQFARAALGCSVGTVRDVWYAVVAPGMTGDYVPEDTELLDRVVSAGQRAGDLGSDGILLDTDARDRVLGRVLAWVRNLPDDGSGVSLWPLVVAAAAHLCSGDGARARVLVERAWALGLEPPRMLQTLTGCLQHGVRPPDAGRLSQDTAGPDVTEDVPRIA